MTKKNGTGDYKVGYCKPPRETQFKPGQSGNLNGKPKVTKANEIDIEGILNREVKANLDGKARRMLGFEAAVWKIAKRAINGCPSSIKKFVNLCEEYRVLEAIARQQGGVIFAPEGMTPQEWIDACNGSEAVDEKDGPNSEGGDDDE